MNPTESLGTEFLRKGSLTHLATYKGNITLFFTPSKPCLCFFKRIRICTKT